MATKYKTQNSLIPGKIWKGRRASIFYWKNSEVQVIYESSTLDENIELLNHQATVEETAARWFFFLLRFQLLKTLIYVIINNIIETKPNKHKK